MVSGSSDIPVVVFSGGVCDTFVVVLGSGWP
jgi:hypothetical protein